MVAKPSRINELLRTVTADVSEHPLDLTRHYADRLKISRVAANKYVHKLEEEGWIARSGPSTRPVFSVGYKRRVSGFFPIQGLDEFELWDKHFRGYLNLSRNVLSIASHGFTEMVNNAIDHSGGVDVYAWAYQDETNLNLLISDDGVGIFAKITDALQLPDKRQALLELAKGKLTTDPTKHTGEGVFFTSRMYDSFEIEANGLSFSHLDSQPLDVFIEAEQLISDVGTTVYMRISLNSERTTQSVFDQFTDAPGNFDFSRTIVPMRLAAYGDEQLVSRSQAKRLIARFDRFKTVVLDFNNVQEVGQAFADELFRVYGVAHPSVELVPIHMTDQVERMWRRAMAPRAL